MSSETRGQGAAQAGGRQNRPGRVLSLRAMRLLRAAQTRLASSLTRRIVVLNLGGLVALLAGFLYLNQFRESLIDARSLSLTTEAEIIAAEMAAAATREAEDFTIDPDKLFKQAPGEKLSEEEERDASSFSLNPDRVGPLLLRVAYVTRTRARVYDREGVLLLDTRAMIDRNRAIWLGQDPSRAAEAAQAMREGAKSADELMSTLRRWMRRPGLELYDENAKSYDEVASALHGATQPPHVRANGKGETIISVAVPVQRYHSIRGALMLSTLGGEIDAIISSERWAIIRIFLVSAGVMLLLSLLFAGAIAEPMRRLAEAAERVRRGVKSRQEIPDFTDRQDEIGHLSGALRDMTRALYNRIEAIEHFAADVAHELKNPLTSLRSAVETLPIAKTETSRERLLEIIKHDVARLDRLISDISDASRLDAELARADMVSLDLSAVLETVVSVANGVTREDAVTVTLTKEGVSAEALRRRWRVFGHDSRLAQVFDNIIANACSFSPHGGEVRVLLRPETGIDMSGYRRDGYEILIDDDGPGIPQGAFERVFERFYTDRPDQGFGNNSGLGLSISRQIIEAHGGRIRALNRTSLSPQGTDEPSPAENDPKLQDRVLGARFAIWLPGQPLP